jgi:hypothetical protein
MQSTARDREEQGRPGEQLAPISCWQQDGNESPYPQLWVEGEGRQITIGKDMRMPHTNQQNPEPVCELDSIPQNVQLLNPVAP